jgi:hypothetical protein
MGRFEQVGYVMADKASDGRELRPDVSVGQIFSRWLKENHPGVCDNYSMYCHKTPQTEFQARQYPNDMLPLYIEFLEECWLPEYAEPYFRSRDPAALAFLPKVLPAMPRVSLQGPRRPLIGTVRESGRL